MRLTSDQFFRRVWLANGILVFVLLLGLAGVIGYGMLHDLWSSDERGVRPTPNRSSDSGPVRPRAIRYDQPERIVNSDWLLVQVRYGTDFGEPLELPPLGPASSARGYHSPGPLVNVMFLSPRRQPVPPDLAPGLRYQSSQLLPDRRLLVTALDPRGAEGKPDDQLPQRAFRFNPRTGELASDAALDSLAARAARLLGR